MNNTDTYYTIEKATEGYFKEKGSKFYSYAFPVFSEEDVKERMSELKKKFFDAGHHCYAFRIGADHNFYRFSDDGEPSSTAGKPIYGQIQSKELTNILIVVIRYFGGTKLGVGGLISAYRQGAVEALESANILKKHVAKHYSISFNYELMNDVMRILKDEKIEPSKQDFHATCKIDFSIRLNQAENVQSRFENLYGCSIKLNFIA